MAAGAGDGDSPIPARTAPPIPFSASDAATIVAILVIFIGLTLLLLWPWLPHSFFARPERMQFQPIAHGQSATRVTLNRYNEPIAWSSESVEAIPAWHIFGGGFPESLQEQLLTLLPELGVEGRYPPGNELFRITTRTLDRNGHSTVNELYVLRRPERDELLAVNFPETQTFLLYTPPVHFALDMNLHPGQSGDLQVQNGSLGGVYTYTVKHQQHYPTQVSTPLGTWQECRQAVSITDLAVASTIVATEHATATYCSGIGLVAQTTWDAINQTTHAYTLAKLADTDRATIMQWLPPRHRLASPSPPALRPEQWTLSVHSQLASPDPTATHTIPPTYVRALHPFILAAGRSGPLQALDVAQPGRELWHFQTGGSIFSPPIVDPATGYIYFGSSDKKLYAVSTDGLYLWHVPVGDNIAAQPVLVGELVIAAVEDGSLIAVDKLTGLQVWRANLDASVLAAPALLTAEQDDLLITGTTDGRVIALVLAIGDVKWQSELDGSIYAPLVVMGNTVYVGTQAASLFSLDAEGNVRWQRSTAHSLRTAPAVDKSSIFVVDEQGWLYAFATADGRHLWQHENATYLGPPQRLPNSDMLIVAEPGAIHALSAKGELLHTWSLADLHSENITPGTEFVSGPTFDGSALWIAASPSILVRLGPQLTYTEQ